MAVESQDVVTKQLINEARGLCSGHFLSNLSKKSHLVGVKFVTAMSAAQSQITL